MKKIKKNNTHYFHESETVIIKNGKGKEKISNIIAKDILNQDKIPNEDQYSHLVNYFGKFKLNFAQEIILPKIQNSKVFHAKDYLLKEKPTNMPWRTERPLFRIPCDLHYYNFITQEESLASEIALYWILKNMEPVWNVNFFIKDKFSNKWLLYPFDFIIYCKTNRKTGFGNVNEIYCRCFFENYAISDEQEFKDFISIMHCSLFYTLDCLYELNIGNSYLLCDQIKKIDKNIILPPNKAAIYVKSIL